MEAILNYPMLVRLRAIREAVLSGQPFTAKSIAQDLGCSAKTIIRDIDFLRDRMGYVLAWDESANTWVGRVPAEPFL
jgi:HTH domain